MQTYEGKVKSFSIKKGRGVLLDRRGEPIPFYRSQLRPKETQSIAPNTKVTFQVAYTFDEDIFALNVTPANQMKTINQFEEESLEFESIDDFGTHFIGTKITKYHCNKKHMNLYLPYNLPEELMKRIHKKN